MYVFEIPRPICGMIPTQQPVRISASLMAYKYGQRSGMALKIRKMAYCQISSSIYDIAQYIFPSFLKTKTSAHCPPRSGERVRKSCGKAAPRRDQNATIKDDCFE